MSSLRTVPTVPAMLSTVALLAGAVCGLFAAEEQTPPPVFRSTVNRILVEVQVVGLEGRPISGLGPADFEVTIDRRQRRVVSSDFIRYATTDDLTPIPISGGGPTAFNQAPVPDRPGRTFVVSIDESSFEVTEAVGVIAAARGFVERLPPDARIGVFTLPSGVRVRPTTDRVAVRQALSTIRGQMSSTRGRFHLSASDVADVVSATGGMPPQLSGPRPQTGVQPPVTNDADLRAILMRTCGSLSDRTCALNVFAEAIALGREMETQVSQSLDGLGVLLSQLGDFPGQKIIVILSAGLPIIDGAGFSGDSGGASRLGGRAARANALIYALPIGEGIRLGVSAGRMTPANVSTGRDRELKERVLGELASASGGALLPATTGSGESALDRVLRETSAGYVLGIAADNFDRDGRLHRLDVKVSRAGATTRSQPWVVLSPSGR